MYVRWTSFKPRVPELKIYRVASLVDQLTPLRDAIDNDFFQRDLVVRHEKESFFQLRQSFYLADGIA